MKENLGERIEKMKHGIVKEIDYDTAMFFLLPRHYSGRAPSAVMHSFGWFFDGRLKAVCTFGVPASHNLCKGLCGEEYSDKVIELSRLCRDDDLTLPLSEFVAECLRRLKPYDYIVVSYSDSAMNHHGYIYQACNFLYTGVTKARTDMYAGGNHHSRHCDGYDGARCVRSAKHRYVYFCSYRGKTLKEHRKALRYPILPYPKGENKNYKLGTFLRPQIVQGEADEEQWLFEF